MNQNQKEQRMLGAMLRIPFQVIVARVDAGLRAREFTDLRPAHFVIFQHIGPAGSRITELADRAQITKQSTGALVDHLVACGYVARLPDPNDGRAKIIRLTERGRKLDNAARAILSQIEQEWAGLLGAERLNQLKEILQDLIVLIDE